MDDKFKITDLERALSEHKSRLDKMDREKEQTQASMQILKDAIRDLQTRIKILETKQ